MGRFDCLEALPMSAFYSASRLLDDQIRLESGQPHSPAGSGAFAVCLEGTATLLLPLRDGARQVLPYWEQPAQAGRKFDLTGLIEFDRVMIKRFHPERQRPRTNIRARLETITSNFHQESNQPPVAERQLVPAAPLSNQEVQPPPSAQSVVMTNMVKTERFDSIIAAHKLFLVGSSTAPGGSRAQLVAAHLAGIETMGYGLQINPVVEGFDQRTGKLPSGLRVIPGVYLPVDREKFA